MSRGPCAKQRVIATVIAPDGTRFVGENDCANPQTVCPRGDMPTGVGYELCKDVCHQRGHAEGAAISCAGSAARGAKLFLEGHSYCCDNCITAMAEAGIAEIIFGPPGVLA